VVSGHKIFYYNSTIHFNQTLKPKVMSKTHTKGGGMDGIYFLAGWAKQINLQSNIENENLIYLEG
jgi:hypothetical protein